MIDSIYKKDKNYYPEVLLEKLIDVYIRKIYFDDSYNVDSDEENSDGKIRTKKIKWKNLFLEKTRKI